MDEEDALLRSSDEESDTDLPTRDEKSIMNEVLENLDVDTDADDTDEDERTGRFIIEYNNTLEDLERNPFVYSKYMQLCRLSHATADLEMIRSAYNKFSGVYPLAADLWLRYLSIEANVALSASEIANVKEIFRRALKDYFSTKIASEYAAFAVRTEDPESIWQEILGTYALHCLKGQDFFKKYRQYLSENTKMSAEEKQDAYIQSFLRELKYPLKNMEESYIEFKVFYEKNKTQITREINWEIIDKYYFKAKNNLQKILPFETQLTAINPKLYRERAKVYFTYIKEMDKFLDENVLQTVYERMVADCCLNSECWITYIDFLDYRDEFGRPKELQDYPLFKQDAVDVNNRALRNCTWSEKLYIKRMYLFEKRGKTREEIQEVLESSLNAGFQIAEPAVAIWIEYLSYLRRHTDWENEAECDILRKNFNLAWTILGQQWGVLADCNCEILQFWGRLEYGPLQNLKRGKELWSTVMESYDNATKSGLWIEFAHLEMRRDLEATRSLFRKALNSPDLDNVAVIASAWERFERCNGTVKTLTACTKECHDMLLQYHVRKEYFPDVRQTKNRTDKELKRKPDTQIGAPSNKLAKTDLASNNKQMKSSDEQPTIEPVFKEHENQEIDLAKDHLRIFVSNLDYNLTERDIRSSLSELNIVSVDLIRSANGRSRGFGYLELKSIAEVEIALTLDRRNLNGRPLFISSVLRDKEKRQKFKYSDGIEPKKLFLKGLPLDTTQAELEKIFGVYGKIKDVRLVYHKSGKFKNIAYVEYEEEKAAGKAVMMGNEMDLRGHLISVAISAPPPKPSISTANPSKFLGMAAKRNKVFDQKPRMSLIPNVVRKQLKETETTEMSADGASTSQIAASKNTNESGAGTGAGAGGKTNEDFRKLLLK